MKPIKRRLGRLEVAALDLRPLSPVRVIIVELSGEAVMNGERFGTEAEAVASIPEGEDHIIVQVVDGRRPDLHPERQGA